MVLSRRTASAQGRNISRKQRAMTSYRELTAIGDASPAGVPQLHLAMRELRRSVEPDVVLSSLARACVPSFSDGCVVELSVGVEPLFEMCYPASDEDTAHDAVSCGDDDARAAQSGRQVVTTPFAMSSAFGRPACAGLVVHTWRGRVPTASDGIIAGLLVDEALSVLRYERLAEAAAAADRRSAELAIATITAKTIGEATGIVMATRHVIHSAAVDLLNAASRQSRRALHDVAREVIGAGALTHLPGEIPHRLDTGSGSARSLRVVP
jgi:hypothetical protein